MSGCEKYRREMAGHFPAVSTLLFLYNIVHICWISLGWLFDWRTFGVLDGGK